MAEPTNHQTARFLIVEPQEDTLALIGYLIVYSSNKTRENLRKLIELGVNADRLNELVRAGMVEFERRIHEHPNS